MKNRIVHLYLLLLSVIYFPLNAQEIPEKATCAVCAAENAHQTTEPEKVAAWSEYQGNFYYFCSKTCQQKFAEDPAAYLPAVFPRPAPSFIVSNLNGEEIHLENYRGKIMLLDFWATWCKPCEKLVPQLQILHEKYAAQGVLVWGISIDDQKDAARKVYKYLEKKKISYPVMLDAAENPAWETFHVKAIPATFLIDQVGNIVAQWIGGFALPEVEMAIARLLAANAEGE